MKYTIYRSCTIIEGKNEKNEVAESKNLEKVKLLLKLLEEIDESSIHTFWAEDENGNAYSPYENGNGN